jgi:hypothetical protein
VRSRAITSDSGTVCRSLGECSIRTTNMIGDRGTVCIGVPGSLVGVVLTVAGSEYAQSVRSCGLYGTQQSRIQKERGHFDE